MATLAEMHPRLVRLIALASDHIEKMFPQTGNVAAMWHWVRADGDHVVALAPPVSKDDGIALMRQVLATEEAVAVLYVDEAWTFCTNDRQEAADFVAAGLTAEQHPRRVEVVVFNAEDDTGNLMGTRKIERPAGKPPRLGPLELEESTWSAGRMVGLLSRGKRTLQ
jgi:hypothetical protein